MKHLKRYAALCMALVVACSAMAVPASATDYQSAYNFWNWAYDNSWFLGKAIIGFSAGNVCQVSEDGLHHATTHSGGGGSVDGQRVYNCVCDHCGEEFQAVATDLEQTYDCYGEDNKVNPSSNGVNITAGTWYPSVSVPYSDSYKTFDEFSYIGDDKYSISFCRLDSGASFSSYFYYDVYVPADIVDKYTLFFPTENVELLNYAVPQTFNFRTYSESGGSSSISINPKSSPSITCTAGVRYRIEFQLVINDYYGAEVGVRYNTEMVIPAPSFSVDSYNAPYTDTYVYLPPSGTLYYNDSDNVSVSVNNPVVDVSKKTIYNPITNTTTNIQNWTYDYSDRTYTVLTDSNNTTTITYGDEYITINEGDNITYNIYYYTAPDSSGDDDSSGSDGSGDDDGGGLLDKIGELIGSVLGGFIDVIGAALGKVIDSLIDLVTLTIDKLVNVINLFGSFGDALGVLWSWLPEEVVTVLVSGVTVIVFASVIKLFMR